MKKLLDFARYLKSDENGVLICIIGTIAQALHTYKIVVYSSQLQDEWMRQLQAIILGLFFSLGLVLYTFRAGSTKKEEPHLKRKYKYYANALAVFEFLVNMHYWTRYFIMTKLNDNIEITLLNWYDWGATCVYSFFLPFMIASYAGHVRIPELSRINSTGNELLDRMVKGTTFQMGRNFRKNGKHYINLKLPEDEQV